MSGRSDGYQSYVLRIWRAGQSDAGDWRASLEDIQTGQRHIFASLTAAFAFLDLRTTRLSDDREGGPIQPISMTERPS